MIFLRLLAAGASFLLCLVPGAAGGLLLLLSHTPTTRTRGGIVEFTFYSVGGLPPSVWVGLAVGGILGAFVAYTVWGVLGRQCRAGGQ